MSKKILITGVAGLLGNHLSRYLLDGGYEVIGIDNLSGGYRDNVDDRLITQGRFHEIDLLDVQGVNRITEYYRPDAVFHFAAYAALGLSPFIRNFNYSNNILASVNVVNACVNYGVRKLVFTSSMDVYGEQWPPFTEDMTPMPEDPYGIAKYCVELDIREAHEHFGLEYTIVRPHNVVGIYQNVWDRYRNVLGIWIRQIIKGEPITVYGDGSVERAFSDIRGYMLPFEKMIDDFNGEIFNIGSDKVYKLIDVANIVLKIGEECGYKGSIVHLEARKEVKSAYCNHDKAKYLLGFEDCTDLESVTREMFGWVLSQPKREVSSMTYEIDKNIYNFWK